MGKHIKNSGKIKQDAVLAQFRKDARSSNANSAVMQCINRVPKKVQKEQVRMSFRFLTTGK
tara:strand:+ start:3604 stop:3786 length:183 start_codon:yes stop_codon:yes gene_type:complete